LSDDSHPTTVLRNNSGMIRDCWWETDEKNLKIFVLRQISYCPNGELKAKVLRLTIDEVESLRQALTREGI